MGLAGYNLRRKASGYGSVSAKGTSEPVKEEPKVQAKPEPKVEPKKTEVKKEKKVEPVVKQEEDDIL